MNSVTRSFRVAATGMLAALVAGCSSTVTNMTPEVEAQLIARVTSGQAYLDCGLGCAGTWGGALGDLRARYARQDWRALASKVMEIGFQNDLAYFYLGRAAEGMGADEAALTYYRTSGSLATGPSGRYRCRGDLCNGIVLPQDLYPRIAQVQANIQRKQPRRPVARPAAPAAPADEWITPPPVTR